VTRQAIILDIDGQSGSGDSQLPRCLNQTPTGLHFLRQVTELEAFTKPLQPSVSRMPPPLLRSSTKNRIGAVHDVKGVDHVIKPQLRRLPDQFSLGEFTLNETSTRF
jgi:hypothetical protein